VTTLRHDRDRFGHRPRNGTVIRVPQAKRRAQRVYPLLNVRGPWLAASVDGPVLGARHTDPRDAAQWLTLESVETLLSRSCGGGPFAWLSSPPTKEVKSAACDFGIRGAITDHAGFLMLEWRAAGNKHHVPAAGAQRAVQVARAIPEVMAIMDLNSRVLYAAPPGRIESTVLGRLSGALVVDPDGTIDAVDAEVTRLQSTGSQAVVDSDDRCSASDG
jgi:hypothetical protein